MSGFLGSFTQVIILDNADRVSVLFINSDSSI